MFRLRILAVAALSLIVASPLTAQTPPARTAPATTAVPASMVDINSATKDQLETLNGVGSARAEAIIKGRPYKAMHELVEKKILPENVYDGIKDKIVAHQAATPATATTLKPAATTATVAPASMVDINSATKDQLETLNGVGSARADAIIKGRPYGVTHDLVEKKVLTQNVYDGIKDNITAQRVATPAPATTTKPAATTAASTPAGATKPTSASTATPAGEFKEEADAKKHCPTDLVVWANTSSKVYHYAGSTDYGKTKQGAYMCQKDSDSAGFRAARNEKPPATKN